MSASSLLDSPENIVKDVDRQFEAVEILIPRIRRLIKELKGSVSHVQTRSLRHEVSLLIRAVASFRSEVSNLSVRTAPEAD